ncbi:hypothetical protein HanLR1_Chr02g0051221 [Helianthus annuus]|nr:hypothetical protein HanHA89_Chr02g0053641 [Helianthus annuus]KAJ0776918.1 hypothetical protein HanLR1_Chr02g0051221 [Helianthus annuus]
MQGECRESRVKIKWRARTEHTLNKTSASNLELFAKCKMNYLNIYKHVLFEML